MGIIKEPKGVDFIVKSEPWSEKELGDFSKLIKEKKANLDPKIKDKVKKLSQKNQSFMINLQDFSSD